MKIKDLINQRFGRLLVLSIGDRIGRMYKWNCQCDCGNTVSVYGGNLRMGYTKSCGCLSVENIKDRCLKHGDSINGVKTAEYRAWRSMKSRCYNKKQKSYPNYGGRGIIVCDRWLNSFENFLADMGRKPSPEHSLDRFPNNDGIYELINCRWATQEQQSKNKRNNHYIDYNGENYNITEVEKRSGVRIKGILRRISKNIPITTTHIPTTIVLNTQTGIFYDSIKEAADSKNYSYQGLIRRLNGTTINDTSFIKA